MYIYLHIVNRLCERVCVKSVIYQLPSMSQSCVSVRFFIAISSRQQKGRLATADFVLLINPVEKISPPCSEFLNNLVRGGGDGEILSLSLSLS